MASNYSVCSNTFPPPESNYEAHIIEDALFIHISDLHQRGVGPEQDMAAVCLVCAMNSLWKHDAC